MKKRKRAARARSQHAPLGDEEVMTDDDEPEAPPLVVRPLGAGAGGVGTALNTTLRTRDVGSGGVACLRGDIDASFPAGGVDHLIALLPEWAAVFGGGIWVVEPFDAGAVIEVGNQDDLNTYLSVAGDTVGFTPLSQKEPAAPRAEQTQITCRIEGIAELTQGKAVLIMMYA